MTGVYPLWMVPTTIAEMPEKGWNHEMFHLNRYMYQEGYSWPGMFIHRNIQYINWNLNCDISTRDICGPGHLRLVPPPPLGGKGSHSENVWEVHSEAWRLPGFVLCNTKSLQGLLGAFSGNFSRACTLTPWCPLRSSSRCSRNLERPMQRWRLKHHGKVQGIKYTGYKGTNISEHNYMISVYEGASKTALLQWSLSNGLWKGSTLDNDWWMRIDELRCGP